MIELPRKVKFIIDKLYENGFEAYAVGGCVRDVMLGRTPKDWDITTSASPVQIKNIFNKTIDTGIAHGTVTVMISGEGFEVTTYRIDGEYEDNRHPKEVIFTSNLIEDLKRRDFTINAMAYNEKDGLVDEFGGIDDLNNKLIRCVGNARDRFNEDALRIMRAARFSAQLGFDIEEETLKAMKMISGNLKNISAERIKTEFDKLLMSSNPDRIYTMYHAGITSVVLPEFDSVVGVAQENPNHIYDVGMHTVKSIEMLDNRSFFEQNESICGGNVTSDSEFDETDYKNELKILDSKIDFGVLGDDKLLLALKWTMLLHDLGKPKMKTIDDKGIAHFKMHEKESEKIAANVFKRLKFDNYTADLAKWLIKWHDYRFTTTKKSIRKAVSKIGKEYFNLIMIVKRADMLAQNPETFKEKCVNLALTIDIFNDIIADGECLSIKELDINGKDLIDSGIKPGPLMGKLMNYLLEYVLESPECNHKDILVEESLKFCKSNIEHNNH